MTFQALLQGFFVDRLARQRQVSAHTIAAYRDTFRLLLRFATTHLHKPPSRLALEDVDGALIGGASLDAADFMAIADSAPI